MEVTKYKYVYRVKSLLRCNISKDIAALMKPHPLKVKSPAETIAYNLFTLSCAFNIMSSEGSSAKDETTKLDNSTYNILMALGKEAKFLYSAIDTYIEDARKDNQPELQDIWNTIKQDRQRHLAMLRGALNKQAKEQKLR